MKTSRKNSKRRSREFEKIAKRLAAYSAAAAATVLTTGDRSANATERVFDVFPDLHTQSNSPGGLGINFDDNDGEVEIDPYGYYSWSAGNFNLVGDFGQGYIYGPAYSTDPNEIVAATCENNYYPFAAGGACGGAARGALGIIGFDENGAEPYGNYASLLPAGYSVGAGDPNDFVINEPYFKRYGVGLRDETWTIRKTGFVGLRFNLGFTLFDNDPNARPTHYGWMLITKLRTVQGLEYVLHGFGWNDQEDTPSKTTLLKGAIPMVTDIPFVGDLNGTEVVDEDDWNIFKLWHLQDIDPNGDFDEDVARSRGDMVTDEFGDLDFENLVDDFQRIKSEFNYYKSRLSLQETHEGELILGASTSVVPEPSAVLLLAAGATGLGIWRRRKQV